MKNILKIFLIGFMTVCLVACGEADKQEITDVIAENDVDNSEVSYETVIEKTRSLGGKADKVRDLIEKFSIGIIVFDEIQLINFNSSKENSIEGLMTLANKTKVAMGVVGTEDAFAMMFKKLRTGRRLGESIIGNEGGWALCPWNT